MVLGQAPTTTATTTTTTATTRTTTTTTTTTTKRIICLAILFVILLFPLSTHESSRDLCKGSDDDAADCAKSPEALSAGTRKITKRRAAKSKFKFHKIERMDEDNAEDGNEDENNSEDMVNDGQSEQNEETNSAGNEEEDDEDEGDGDVDGDEDDNGNDNDNDNDNEAGAEDDLDEDKDGDGDGDRDEDEEKPSLFSRIVAIFTSDAANETATERVNEKAKAKAKAKESQSQYPNIINWFHWLIDQTGDDAAQVGKKKEKLKLIKSDIDWLTYLKRWPFNSIFPETPDAKARNREGNKAKQEQQQREGDGAAAAKSRQQSKSEEYMELLIHSLPAFIGNVAQVKSGECHQQLELLHQQLRSHKLWTLQMLDATGKIGAGLLRGNINQFGDFDQCTQVSTSVKVAKAGKATRVHGKYCLAQIEMRSTTNELKDPLHLLHGRGLWHAQLKNPKHFAPRYSIANWGICLPHACSAHVVHTIIETSLRPYNDTGIEFHIDVRDEHCTTKRRKNFMKLLSKDNNLALGIFGIATLGFACILSSVWEHWDWINSKILRQHNDSTESTQADESERTEEVLESQEENEAAPTDKEQDEISPALHLKILNAFSPQRTWQSLVSLEGPDIEFPLIHLLKLLATFMIYVNLKFIMAGHLPITNRDAFVGTVNRYWSLAYRVPLLYSDLLLLLSGFLVAHKLSHEMETTCRLSFLRNVAAKACRYVPSILAVLGFQTWILPHLGAGPLWNLLVGENARLCEENMWRSALSVQNTADVEEMCSPPTVQLSLDMQLYFLGALVVWLYFTDPEAGFFLCGAFHAISVAARYSRTQREHLAPSLFHGIHVSKFYRTANLIYTSPITRATTYMLGIGAGLLFRSESGVFRIAPRFKRTGWVLAMLAIVWCFCSPASGIRSKYVYKSSDAAAYLAWSPLILGLGICWSILMAPLDKSTMQRFPNIARGVLLLSRIEIPLQLVSYVVVLWNTASVKEPHQFLLSDLISLEEVVCIVIFAIIVAFLIDFPAQEIGLLILDFNFSDPLLPSIKDNAADPTNPANEESTDPKSESPEPIDSIWSSESDPENEKSSE